MHGPNITVDETFRWNWKEVDGKKFVCRGWHHNSEDCEWEPYEETMAPTIDLYDTPIDLRPVPKPESNPTITVEEVRELLRNNGDHFGVTILNEYLKS